MSVIYESGEMYLETILQLKEQKGAIRSIDIVREMGFSKPSVSIGIRKLKEGNYVNVDPDGYITFTEKGEEVARKIYERHTILSNILIHLGVDESTALEDACKMEHIISDETFEAIKNHFKETL